MTGYALLLRPLPVRDSRKSGPGGRRAEVVIQIVAHKGPAAAGLLWRVAHMWSRRGPGLHSPHNRTGHSHLL